MFNIIYQEFLCPLAMFFGKGVMMKLRVDAAEHGLSQNYLRRKKVLPFTYEFHSWIKGRIEMESIIPPSLVSCLLSSCP